MRMKSSWMGLVTLIRRNMKEMISHSTSWGHSKEYCVQARERGLTMLAMPAPWFQTSQPPELWEINFYCSSHLVCLSVSQKLTPAKTRTYASHLMLLPNSSLSSSPPCHSKQPAIYSSALWISLHFLRFSTKRIIHYVLYVCGIFHLV